MPAFTYSALNAAGAEVKGAVLASDARSAVTQLRERSLFVVEISEDKGKGGLAGDVDLGALQDWRSVSTQELIFIFRQLTFMLRAGLPVLQALELAKTQVSSERLVRIIEHLLSDIENGSPLSQAMAKHPKVFDTLSINLVVAGEATGELDSILDRLATHMEKRRALKIHTINAMIYPAVVVIAAVGVLIFLVVKIIPAFAKFLANKGHNLPASTQFLIDLSAFALQYGLYIVGFFILLIVSFVLVYNSPEGRLKIDAKMLKLPVMGKLLTQGAMAQLNWSMAMMLRSGLTVLDALKIAANVIGNQAISTKLRSASEQILEGRDLSSSMQDKSIPIIVTQMVAVGERTGTLDHVLQELGIYYEDALQASIKRLSSMIEPALILVIGGMVGFVYYAFFQALFKLAKGG